MTTSLFTTPLPSITADDVQAFLDLDQEEGLRLDYKGYDSRNKMGLPETIYRAVCAFANTYGGVIVVGVDADGATNRPTKRDGIPLKKGLEEAITSKCQSLIFPPVSPEIAVIAFTLFCHVGKSAFCSAADNPIWQAVRTVETDASSERARGEFSSPPSRDDRRGMTQYAGETRNWDLAAKNFKVVKEDGQWKVCGYQ